MLLKYNQINSFSVHNYFIMFYFKSCTSYKHNGLKVYVIYQLKILLKKVVTF